MKILLINPNRYITPPVAPIGLEYLESAIANTGHECRIVDLCFAGKPFETLGREIEKFLPDIVGISVRNIDTVLFQNNVFFLDGIRDIVGFIKARSIPVIAGGAGFSFAPMEVLEYIGADYGIFGPGEKALVNLLDLLEKRDIPGGILFNGWKYGIDPDIPVIRGKSIDYKKYFGKGGIAGFETQKGCFEKCSFCSEGGSGVIFRNIGVVLDEISQLCDAGAETFHLCDTEFNQNLEFCTKFLSGLIKRKLPMRWALYMKSKPYDNKLFGLLRESGAYLVTLTVTTEPDVIDNAGEIARLAKGAGVGTAFDFICGFPWDTGENIASAFDKIRRINPGSVGVNSYIRIYPGTPVYKTVFGERDYSENIIGEIKGNAGLLKPVYYNKVSIDMLREIIKDDPLFKIEGFERTTNYERLK